MTGQSISTSGAGTTAPHRTATGLRFLRGTVFDQLRHSLFRADVHPLVRKYGRVLDLLHEYDADGVLSGNLRRMPGCGAAAQFRRCGHSAECTDGRGWPLPCSTFTSRVRPADGGRRGTVVAAAGVLRHRSPPHRPVAFRRANRAARRRLLRADRPDLRRARASDGP